jgi:1-phosphatidylinositol-4-phosphate 5-kinase
MKVKHEEIETDAFVSSFAPQVFRYLRAQDNIGEYEIMKSVKPQLNKLQIFKSNANNGNTNSGGKSDSFFFFTEDNKFIIKTITFTEKETLMSILPKMVDFVVQTGGKSLISRVYGLYKIEYPGISPVHLMLQRNNIQILPNNSLLAVFDLKGSRYTRQTLADEVLFGRQVAKKKSNKNKR